MLRIIICTLVFGLYAVAGPVSRPKIPSPTSRPAKALFVGNSYTFGNNLPAIVGHLAEARKIQLNCRMVAAGGATLADHLAGAKKSTAIDQIATGDFDVVIFQEQSQRPFRDMDAMRAAARELVAKARARGLRVVLMLTWARQNMPEAQANLNYAYCAIAKELGVEVAPVGIAWAKALAAKPDLTLHVADGSHPNVAGSYLAACVIFATLTGEDPAGLPPTLGSKDAKGQPHPPLNDATARFLQGIAGQAVAEFKIADHLVAPPPIPAPATAPSTRPSTRP